MHFPLCVFGYGCGTWGASLSHSGTSGRRCPRTAPSRGYDRPSLEGSGRVRSPLVPGSVWERGVRSLPAEEGPGEDPLNTGDLGRR